MNELEELKNAYSGVEKVIKSRLFEFKQVFEKGDDAKIFAEFAFCLLTPQSKAKVCNRAILRLVETGLLFNGSASEISKNLIGVRFLNRKAEYIVEARNFFKDNYDFKIKEFIKSFSDVLKLREFLVKNIKGMGYKEASHFLRNIGMGEKLAILDRHILKNLYNFGVIEKIPVSISKKVYLDIEKKLMNFSDKIGIPPAELDLLLWYKETGEVFK